MQSVVDFVSTSGSRFVLRLAQQVGAQHGASVAPSLASLSSLACPGTSSRVLLSSYKDGILSLRTSATVAAGRDDNVMAAPRGADTQVLAPSTAAMASATPLHLEGSRGADPGEPRYTAPYFIPKPIRDTHRLPSVLFTDPWPSHGEREIRSSHAQACLHFLRRAGRPLTLEQVHAGVNELLLSQASEPQQHSDGDGDGSAPPTMVTPSYVKFLLEHLRRSRLAYGIKNPESNLSAGHPAHPRLYQALPYQATRMGNPEQLAKEDATEREKAVVQAYKRLRRHKPPYAIHRRRARFSVWQHLQLQEAVQGLQASG